MAETGRVELARMGLAEVTGELEDATIIAAEGQVTPDLAEARRSCERLIAVLEACPGRLQHLRRQLG